MKNITFDTTSSPSDESMKKNTCTRTNAIDEESTKHSKSKDMDYQRDSQYFPVSSKSFSAKNVVPGGSVRDRAARTNRQFFSSKGAFIHHPPSGRDPSSSGTAKMNMKISPKISSLEMKRNGDPEVLFVANVPSERKMSKQKSTEIGERVSRKAAQKKKVSFATAATGNEVGRKRSLSKTYNDQQLSNKRNRKEIPSKASKTSDGCEIERSTFEKTCKIYRYFDVTQ